MNRIEQIAEAARAHVPKLILDMSDRIEAAITDAVETEPDDESTPSERDIETDPLNRPKGATDYTPGPAARAARGRG